MPNLQTVQAYRSNQHLLHGSDTCDHKSHVRHIIYIAQVTATFFLGCSTDLNQYSHIQAFLTDYCNYYIIEPCSQLATWICYVLFAKLWNDS